MAAIVWLDNSPAEIRAGLEALRTAGHDVEECRDEASAIARLQGVQRPALLIQDLHRRFSKSQVRRGLPRQGPVDQWSAGWSFYLEVLKPHFPELPILICTTNAADIRNQRLADDFNLAIVQKGRRLAETLPSIVGELIAAQRVILDPTRDGPASFVVAFDKVNTALIRHLASHPTDIHKLHWATFEDLIERLLTELGYEVTHTPLTRDGGVDLWALERGDLGERLYAIDAKKYRSDVRVGPEPIRAIYGVVSMHDATAGMIVTTAHFSQGARELANQYRYRIALRDFDGIVDWIKHVRNQ